MSDFISEFISDEGLDKIAASVLIRDYTICEDDEIKLAIRVLLRYYLTINEYEELFGEINE